MLGRSLSLSRSLASLCSRAQGHGQGHTPITLTITVSSTLSTSSRLLSSSSLALSLIAPTSSLSTHASISPRQFATSSNENEKSVRLTKQQIEEKRAAFLRDIIHYRANEPALTLFHHADDSGMKTIGRATTFLSMQSVMAAGFAGVMWQQGYGALEVTQLAGVLALLGPIGMGIVHHWAVHRVTKIVWLADRTAIEITSKTPWGGERVKRVPIDEIVYAYSTTSYNALSIRSWPFNRTYYLPRYGRFITIQDPRGMSLLLGFNYDYETDLDKVREQEERRKEEEEERRSH